MYAIVQIGGRQVRVEKGSHVRVPKLNKPVGEIISFNDVLLLSDDGEVKIGAPTVDNCTVETKIVSHGKDPKIIVFKIKRRKGYRKKQGHRQEFTELFVKDIVTGEKKVSKKKKAVEKPVPEEKASAEGVKEKVIVEAKKTAAGDKRKKTLRKKKEETTIVAKKGPKKAVKAVPGKEKPSVDKKADKVSKSKKKSTESASEDQVKTKTKTVSRRVETKKSAETLKETASGSKSVKEKKIKADTKAKDDSTVEK